MELVVGGRKRRNSSTAVSAVQILGRHGWGADHLAPILFVVAGLLGIVVYQLMCLSDLEFDYINPFDSSSRINRFVIPEFALQGGLSIFFLLTGHWLMCLLNIPLGYYHTRLYLENRYHVDVTEIFNLLSKEKQYRLAKLGFYLVLFFLIIYRLVVAAVLLILESDTGPEM